jgi:lipoate-protein ligase A
VNPDTWHWLDTGANDAALNMALDEALLQSANDRGIPLLRVYEWTRQSVSVGYFQAYPAEFEPSHAIVRRLTGGGLVFHGQDLTFTIIAPRDHVLYKLCVCDCYKKLHGLIADALRMGGYNCSLHSDPRNSHNNICFESPVPHDIVLDGRKICGGAQRRMKAGFLHQGSLLLPRSLRRPTGELKRTLRANLKLTLQEMELSAAERDLAEQLARSKYATDEWNKKVTAVPQSASRQQGVP